MSTTVTLQLNATDHAGDWANRPVGSAGSGTGALGASSRVVEPSRSDEFVVVMSELRGVVDSIKRGVHSPNMADSRTEIAELGYGTPIMYTGMRFAIGYA